VYWRSCELGDWNGLLSVDERSNPIERLINFKVGNNNVSEGDWTDQRSWKKCEESVVFYQWLVLGS